MENQPTTILLLFTDYLNNRDSLSFFRLSSSLWSSHRSPAGRYRLKASDDEKKFLRPSNIPVHCISSPLSSPSSGHFLLEFLHLDDFTDFSHFLRLGEENSSEAEENQKTRKLGKIKQLAIKMDQIDKMIETGRKIPSSVENVRLFGNWPPSLSVKALKDFLPVEGKIFNLNETLKLQSTNIEDADFSYFPRLEELKLWPGFNSSLRPSSSGPSPFPATLRLLHFYAYFNKILPEGILPDSLEELQFSAFNLPLPRLPKNLRILDLGNDFDQLIRPGQLPERLKILRLSIRYNRPLELNTFPPGIEEITFPPIYNHPLLPGLFPSSLKTLHFYCREFSFPIEPGVLPEALENLTLFLRPEYSHPPPSLPSGLKSFTFNESFRLSLDSPNNFPARLRAIKFSGALNESLPLGFFPSSIEEIDFGIAYNQPLKMGIFPTGIKKVVFGHLYDQVLPVGIFPEGIRIIQLGLKFSHRLEVGLFPSSVRKLKISTKHPLPMGIFPEGLESISFCPGFNERLLPGIFPSSLRSLKFMSAFGHTVFYQDFLPGVLPQFLCEFDVGIKYFGKFPLSARPPYFLPDFPLNSETPENSTTISKSFIY